MEPPSSSVVTVLDRVTDWAHRDPDRAALLAGGERSWSYRDVHEAVASSVAALRDRGLLPADRIGLLMPDTPACAVALVALGSHCACAPLPPGMPASEFEQACSVLGLRTIVHAGSAGDAVRWAEAQGMGVVSLEIARDGVRAAGAAGPPRRAAPGPGLLMMTSGTSGRRKVVPIPPPAWSAGAEIIARALELTPGDRCLNLTPLYHVSGQFMALFAAWMRGGSVICVPEASHPDVLARHAHLAPTWACAVPAQLSRLAETATDQARRLRLAFIHTGAAALVPAVQSTIEAAFDAPVIQSYGMTETIMISCNPRSARRPGTVGTPRQSVRIVLDGERDARPGEIGEVVVRGPAVMAGYLDEEPTSTAGWFHTGDAGMLDADGYLSITGRFKEMINRGGEKVFPAEVDAALEGHPAVLEAAAFAVPHPDLGEDVAAAVVLRDGHTADESTLRHYLGERLQTHKVPRRIVVVAEIPRNRSGKKMRDALPRHLPVSADAGPGSANPAEWAGLSPDTLRARLARRICEIVERSVGVRPPVDRGFVEHGLDSIGLTELCVALERAVGLSVSATDLFRHTTPETLADTLASRLERPAVPPAARAASERPLSLSEHCWVNAAETSGTGIVVEGLRVRGPLTAALLRQALATLAERHPLLSVHAAGHGWKRRFVRTGTLPVPVEESRIPVGKLDEWLEDLLNRPGFRHGAPLLEASLVRLDDTDGESAIVLRANHAIWDGGNEFMRELWHLLADTFAGRTARPDAVPPLPSTDELTRASASGTWHGAARCRLVWDLCRHQMPRFADRRGPRRTRILRLDWTREEQDRMDRAARHEGVTPLALYTAAALRALHRSAGMDSLTSRYSVITAVDVRSHYLPPVANVHLGCHWAAIVASYSVAPGDTLGALARECRRRFTASLAAGHAIDLFPLCARLFQAGVRHPWLLGRAGRTATLTVSAPRGFVDFPRRSGPFTVTDFLCGTSMHDGGPCHALLFVPVPDGLRCVLHHASPLISAESAAALRSALGRELAPPPAGPRTAGIQA